MTRNIRYQKIGNEMKRITQISKTIKYFKNSVRVFTIFVDCLWWCCLCILLCYMNGSIRTLMMRRQQQIIIVKMIMWMVNWIYMQIYYSFHSMFDLYKIDKITYYYFVHRQCTLYNVHTKKRKILTQAFNTYLPILKKENQDAY